jgi:hypothetical protein
VAFSSWGELEEQIIELKNTRPMKTITIRKKV